MSTSGGDSDAQAAQLGRSLRAAAGVDPERLPLLLKDAGILAKLLRNPAMDREEPKYRRIKLSNAAIARVLAHVGARALLEACGWAAGSTDADLELPLLSEAHVELLLRSAQAVEAVRGALQELQWVYAARAKVPLLGAQPWEVDGAARALVQSCLRCLLSPTAEGAASATLSVELLHCILATPSLGECRQVVAQHISVALEAVQRAALTLVRAGAACDVRALALCHKCLALLAPPGEPATLQARLDFCLASLESTLPPPDEPMELRLRLARGDLLGSTEESLGAFTEVGVRCGVLKQELAIEYCGEEGQDAGGLRRQYFDRFTSELVGSGFWVQTAAGGLCPLDSAALRGGAEAQRAAARHFEMCGRVCGMALCNEIHRRAGLQEMIEAGQQAPVLLGAAFSRHFVRAVQHDPPNSLAELQAELRAETVEAHPDYRASEEILSRSLEESGLEGQLFFARSVGGVSVPLVEGGEGIVVTSERVGEWLERLLRSELVEGIADAASHFRKGLLDVLGLGYLDASDADVARWTTPHLCLLSAQELLLQWSGAPVSSASVDELRATAVVHPEIQRQAGWLWEVLLALDDEKRAKVYRFVTGSSRRPRGVGAPLHINPKEGGDGAFPFAHACASTLDVPHYSSQAVLRERLEAAVEAAHDKFTDL